MVMGEFMDISVFNDERIDDLEFKGLKIVQSPSCFCFGIDAVLLSDFAKEIRKNSVVADLCSGNGIVSILLCGKTEAKKFYAVEVQNKIADMASRSVMLNGLQDRIEVLNLNLNLLPERFSNGFFDAVVCNPPYMKSNCGLVNSCEEKVIARHEVLCSLEDVVSITSRLLKNGGAFYMVHRPDRLVDIISLLRKFRLEPKVLQFVQPFSDKAPNLLLIKAVKNGNAFLKILKPLVVYNDDGNYTNDILKIYNKI